MVKRCFVFLVLVFACMACTRMNRIRIEGYVVIKGSQEPLEAVHIEVDGTMFQATSDDSGRYELAGLPAVDCTLLFVRASCDTVKVDVVEPRKGERYRIDVALQPRG